MRTFESGEVAADFQQFLEGLVVLLVGLLEVDAGEGLEALGHELFCPARVLAEGQDFEVQVPDVEVEDEQAFVGRVLGWVARGPQLLQPPLPLHLLVLQRKLVAQLYSLEMLPDGYIAGEGVDVVLGILQSGSLLIELRVDDGLALHEDIEQGLLGAVLFLGAVPELVPEVIEILANPHNGHQFLDAEDVLLHLGQQLGHQLAVHSLQQGRLVAAAEERAFLPQQPRPRAQHRLVELRDVAGVVEVVYHGVQAHLHALDAVAHQCPREQHASLAAALASAPPASLTLPPLSFLPEEKAAVLAQRKLHHSRGHIPLYELLDGQLEDALQLTHYFPHHTELLPHLPRLLHRSV